MNPCACVHSITFFFFKRWSFDLPGLSIETLSRSGPIMTWYRPTNKQTNKHTKISKKKTKNRVHSYTGKGNNTLPGYWGCTTGNEARAPQCLSGNFCPINQDSFLPLRQNCTSINKVFSSFVLFIVVYLVGSKVSGNFSGLLVQQHTAYSICFRWRCINVVMNTNVLKCMNAAWSCWDILYICRRVWLVSEYTSFRFAEDQEASFKTCQS